MNVIHIPLVTSRIINGLLLVFILIINFFYAFCIIFPPKPGQRKQPLTILLTNLILCTVCYCAFFSMLELFSQHLHFIPIFRFILFYTVDYSMVSYVWLNFYYYIQIVPAQSALFHWVKRNIKSTIYVLLGIDILITIMSRIKLFTSILVEISGFPSNATAGVFAMKPPDQFSFFVIMMHGAVMLCVSVVSSLSTVCYLHKHMKNMGKMGTSISATRLRGQMRVTITGIFQGVLFFFYVSYLLCSGFTVMFSKFTLSIRITFTINTFFLSGTTVTLGIGQNVFRQRIVDMYKALKRVSIFQKSE
ncbi:hypothetical protein NQD34_015762 [Periophthalmus magnuspinnatus]|nr:hypothetical protein NQD34_015762 [Periophthalmus magnuspinnatus]